MFDFSFLSNIDFTNKENLLFLAVVLIIAVIVLAIIFLVLYEIIKIIRKLIRKIFGIEAKKPKLNKKDTDWLHDQTIAPKHKIIDAGFTSNFNTGEKKENFKDQKQNFDEKEKKDIAEGLSKLKISESKEKDTLSSKMPSRSENQQKDEHEKIEIPKTKRF